MFAKQWKNKKAFSKVFFLCLGTALMSITSFWACSFDPAGIPTVTHNNNNNTVLCGDSVRQGNETCDGNNLDGHSCLSHGFDGGTLTCLGDCTGFDTSGCIENECGDGVINGNEECDGDDLGAMTTCTHFGCRSQGTISCNTDCTYNISNCLAGHDEDGDFIDDNCDNCPAYSNDNQDDSDNDGVGNICEAPGAFSANFVMTKKGPPQSMKSLF